MFISRAHARFARSRAAAAALIISLSFAASTTAADATSQAARTPRPEQAAPIGNLTHWKNIYHDDFTTTVALGGFPSKVSTKWGAYPYPWKDTTGYGTYNPGKVVSIANGVLNEYIHMENGVPLVAALLPKVPGTGSNGGRLYGRYAVRFRADHLANYKMAWMLWPDSGRQQDGEIDFPEMNLTSSYVYAFMHHQGATSGSDQDYFKKAMDVNNWHTTVIEWSPGKVVFSLDGVEIGRSTSRVPNTPMHWVLQTETAINTGTKPSSTVKGNVQIDWVSAWSYVA